MSESLNILLKLRGSYEFYESFEKNNIFFNERNLIQLRKKIFRISNANI